MSKYPVWWDTTITVYNKHTDATTNVTTWYRTKLTGCFWKYVRNKAKLGETTLETESTVCRIPQNVTFMEKHLWEALKDKSGTFTLGRGDIIVKGEVTDTINEYQSGSRSTDLIAKYKELQGCIEIDTVALDDGPGRCMPHYRVQGM